MNTYAKQLKEHIFSIISKMSETPEKFTVSQSNAFTRKGKWTFSTIMNFILGFGSNSLGYEIGDFFDYKKGFPTVSSFVQQRKKLKYTAFEHLLQEFNEKTNSNPKLYKGYRLLAVDGSDTPIPFNPGENNCRIDKHTSEMHLNSLFDLLGKIHVDIMPECDLKKDEPARACDMIDRISDEYPCIFIADRNYESYNLFAHVEERLFDYVVRVKDISSNGILSGMKLPEEEEFDVTLRVFIERQHSMRSKMLPHKYKYIAKNKRFDFDVDDEKGYELLIRLVRFKITENSYECLATSLSEEEFSAEELKEIYNLRWGIETSFRELKHILGISAFHSKQENSILQEIYARVIIYNFSMQIAQKVRIKEKNLKHKLQINYTQAIRICQHYFKSLNFEVSYDIEATIKRFLLPVRPHRNYKRTNLEKETKKFNYRLA